MERFVHVADPTRGRFTWRIFVSPSPHPHHRVKASQSPLMRGMLTEAEPLMVPHALMIWFLVNSLPCGTKDLLPGRFWWALTTWWSVQTNPPKTYSNIISKRESEQARGEKPRLISIKSSFAIIRCHCVTFVCYFIICEEEFFSSSNLRSFFYSNIRARTEWREWKYVLCDVV